MSAAPTIREYETLLKENAALREALTLLVDAINHPDRMAGCLVDQAEAALALGKK